MIQTYMYDPSGSPAEKYFSSSLRAGDVQQMFFALGASAAATSMPDDDLHGL